MQIHKKRCPKNRTPSSRQSQRLLVLLIVTLCVAAHKLIHTTCGVNQLHLTSVERVRCVRDFHLVHRIGFAVHFDGLFCRNGGPAQKHVVIRHILECHQTIIFWVNTFLHVCNVFELNAFSDCKGKQFIFTDKHFRKKITIIYPIYADYTPCKAFDNFLLRFFHPYTTPLYDLLPSLQIQMVHHNLHTVHFGVHTPYV